MEAEDCKGTTTPEPPPNNNNNNHISDGEEKAAAAAASSSSSSAVPPLPPSAMDLPPLQTMTASPSGYDPNRIPLSIFSSKPTNPQEWSVASNELFSIHMGNGSFSRDYDFLFGKSGELLKPEELNAQQYLRAKSGELSTQGNNNNNNKSSNDLSPVKEDHDHEEPEKKNTIEERANDTANNAVEEEKAPPATAEVKKVIPMSPPRYSDGSGNSVTSFAFPVFVQDTNSGSLKVVPEKQQPVSKEQQEQPASKEQQELPVSKEEQQPGATTRWYSFLSCFPHCC